jgi:CCR4-NOT transcription complex subunit 1
LSTAPEEVTVPPSEPLARASQATQFIINQLTAVNVSDKVVKMRELLQVEHPRRALAQGRAPEPDDPARVSIDWFAQYLVVKRVASQANFHDVYLSFIEQLETKQNELSKAVLRCTLKICRQLLSSDTIRVEEQERRLLKTLGGWLGLVTLARNKPVLHRDLDLKELLYVAYERGSLVAVMPFVAKVMDGAQKSKIFGELSFMYRYISRESCSQFDSLPLTSLTISFISATEPMDDGADERAARDVRRS